MLFKHNSGKKKKHSEDPQSNNKISKVGLISVISGRKLCAQLLNMNQTVSLVGRSNNIIYMNQSIARCFYWKETSWRAEDGLFLCSNHISFGC